MIKIATLSKSFSAIFLITTSHNLTINIKQLCSFLVLQRAKAAILSFKLFLGALGGAGLVMAVLGFLNSGKPAAEVAHYPRVLESRELPHLVKNAVRVRVFTLVGVYLDFFKCIELVIKLMTALVDRSEASSAYFYESCKVLLPSSLRRCRKLHDGSHFGSLLEVYIICLQITSLL